MAQGEHVAEPYEATWMPTCAPTCARSDWASR